MATTNYKVEADFRLRGVQAATAQVASLSDRLGTLGAKIRGASGGAGGLVGGLVGVGAAYTGVRLLAGGFMAAARGAVAFKSEVAGAQVGLASVISAVDKISFDEAQKQASGVFRQLQDDAIKSVATTKDLFSVYQQITGPIRAAGFGMEKVREITNSTVSAATALGVDLPQATRDIGMMVSGVAGQDVKLFRMLKATGVIKENAEEWNKGLTQGERIEKLTGALNQFAPAADAYSKSWGGLTSSLRDIVELSLGALGGPTLEKLQGYMSKWIDRFVKNRDRAMAKVTELGEKIAGAFSRVFEAGDKALTYVVNNWDQIIKRVESVVSSVKEMVPKLVQAAKLYAGVSIARSVVGGGLQVAGGAANIGDQIAKSAAFRGLLAAPAAIGAESAGMAGIGLGGAGWGVVGSFEALGAALAPLAAVLVPIAGMIVLVSEHWRQLSSIISSFMEGPGASIGQTFMDLFANLYEAVKPFLKIIGLFVGLGLATIVGTLVAQLTLMAKAANWVLDALWPVTDAFQWLADVLTNYVLGAIKEIIGFVNDEDPNSRRAKERGTGGPGAVRKMFDMAADAASGSFDFMGANGGKGAGKPPVTPPPQIDMRGAKITVKQDFRDADPDNVAYQMMADIGKQASARAQSGFVPALSR